MSGTDGAVCISEPVGAALAGLRLDRAVAIVAEVSRSAAARIVAEGGARLDGAALNSRARRVVEGEELSVRFQLPTAAAPAPDPAVAFGVAFEDSQVVVVDKPPGLVVHPGAGNEDSTLVNGLLARWPEIAAVGDPQRPGIVHRLDRDTSGLMAVALTSTAYDSLSEQLRARTVERVYCCLVSGHVAADAGLIDSPIGRSRRNPLRMTVTERGLPARTRYGVEQRYDEPFSATLLVCRLETGRTHQIRVHLRAIGHPVIGDRVYAGPGAMSVQAAAVVACDRQFLHSRELAFVHPTSGEQVRTESQLPADLRSVLAAFA